MAAEPLICGVAKLCSSHCLLSFICLNFKEVYKNACISTTLKCLNMCKHWIGLFRLAFRLSELSFLTKFTIINCPHQLQILMFQYSFTYFTRQVLFLMFSLEILHGELAHRHPKWSPHSCPTSDHCVTRIKWNFTVH